MCGGRRNRALQYQQTSQLYGSLLSAMSPHSRYEPRGSIGSLVGAVGSLALKSHEMEPPYNNTVPVYPGDYKTDFDGDAPPTYEKATAENLLEVATREMSHSSYNTMNSSRLVSHPMELPPHFQTTSPHISRLIETLTSALTSYHSGVGRWRHVRRAQKALRNELYEEEVARRESMYGRLRCGERCEIWREIKAIDLEH